jgi:hypothetical protein
VGAVMAKAQKQTPRYLWSPGTAQGLLQVAGIAIDVLRKFTAR